MALTGLKSFLYGALTEHANGSVTYEAPKKLAGAISSKVKFNTNSTELYSDDVLKYSDYSVLQKRRPSLFLCQHKLHI